jgi:multiple sugar transport system ATP-binding protein
MYRLEVKNISKNFGKITAVKNLSFNCEEGETITLLGPTGAGKTTTLRCLAGLEQNYYFKMFGRFRGIN